MLKYLELLKLSFINRLDHRQELVMSLLIGIIIFAGQAIFWKAVFRENEIVNGFTFKQILNYYLFARIISEIIESRLGFKVSDLIQKGEVSNYLLKPVKIKSWLFIEEAGRIGLDVIIKVGIYLALFILLFGSLDIKIENLPVFLVMLFLALIISLNLFFLVGCTAFMVDNASGINHSLRRFIMFLAGGLIPVSFFPEFMQKAINFLPFKYIFDFPVRALTNGMPNSEVLIGVTIQLVWAIALWVVSEIIFRSAIKHNQSVGI